MSDKPVSANITFADFITLSVTFLTEASGFVNFLAVWTLGRGGLELSRSIPVF